MKTMPRELKLFKQTPVFDAASAPDKLGSEHATGPGVWGRIQVVAGSVTYEILGGAAERHVLSPGNPGIIQPELPHRVRAAPGATFFIELYRAQ